MGASGFAHLLRPGFGAPLQFGGSNVFDVLSETPLVSEGIPDFAVAVSPELILQRHLDFGAGLDGAFEESIHIVGVDEEGIGGDGTGAGCMSHTGEFVAEHQTGIADLKFGMADGIARTSHAV